MKLNYKPPLPDGPPPIVIIGAGGIVKDAHLPAYSKAGFEVYGLADIAVDKAQKLAEKYDIPHVFSSAAEAVAAAPSNAVYDLALVADQSRKVLKQLPDGAPVLIQKPMGDSYNEAKEIHQICKSKNLTAAVNFQLRYAPFVSAARQVIDQGLIGEIYDMEVRLTTHTPWEIFPSLMDHPRLEIMYHSIHYIDLIRSFLGTPKGVMAKTLRHPAKEISSTRTTLLFDYGDTLHAVINTNHDHEFGPENQESFIKWEGTKGAIKAKMGLLLDYPKGKPDKFEYCLLEEDKEPRWQTQKLDTSWFPDAFIGTMASLMRFVEGSSPTLPTCVDDALETMAAAESAYISNNRGGAWIEDRSKI
ncbi:Gfo/Idh/MocA family protein [Fodinibius salsisoli]|uniref:Gfo/Idh/MocA family oxidoreductase n=1 Tax=Fodinibius salsisoli TaxID=2820877 RepID=A0ABT3PH89_9BACT|nr:Gfo/Idh/MocA family oxidoreductase [Fodinibius salsisoli]MCW9705290.1 Gfo/Idh/MocA family oxidoreductase [Fodinibius salsisoli]